jgi:hypothetical protein
MPMPLAAWAPQDWDCLAAYDAGEKACGDLIFDLRFFFQSLLPSTLVCVRALDPAAHIDLAAWCRQTGHKLLEARPPLYLIERRT